jgi:hypothetical protein
MEKLENFRFHDLLLCREHATSVIKRHQDSLGTWLDQSAGSNISRAAYSEVKLPRFFVYPFSYEPFFRLVF